MIQMILAFFSTPLIREQIYKLVNLSADKEILLHLKKPGNSLKSNIGILLDHSREKLRKIVKKVKKMSKMVLKNGDVNQKEKKCH